MIKPKRLQEGDKIAVVSLSWGGIGDENLIHKFEIAKERLENDFGLEVIAMPNALKGSKFIYENPEARAKDLMDAFKDDSIKGIFCAIGGSDTIRTLPYIDYDVIQNNPKIFIGYSDTTVNHFMMNKASLVSFYGPSVMCEFGEYVKMFDYTKEAVLGFLFNDSEGYQIKSSAKWSKDRVEWDIKNINVPKKMIAENKGYEVLQGSGIIRGKVLGGCLDVFPMVVGTNIWPTLYEWKDKILYLETSEDQPEPDVVIYYLRNLGALGILNVIKGIMMAKPADEKYYEEYKESLLKVLKEYHREDLPVLYNMNIGHTQPVGIMPFGIELEIDFDKKEITLLESATE